MFTIIVVALLSLVMWVLGALIIAQGILEKYPGKFLSVILSVPVIPWLKAVNWDWQIILISTFFYILSILGIISIFHI